MKKLITAIAIGALTFAGTATNTEARPYWERGLSSPSSTVYVSGYRCGQPVYTERIFLGYDCHGRPQYTYRTISSRSRGHCAPVVPPPCRSYHHSGYSRSGASVSFTFRR